jgi:hypothetical protein
MTPSGSGPSARFPADRPQYDEKGSSVTDPTSPYYNPGRLPPATIPSWSCVHTDRTLSTRRRSVCSSARFDVHRVSTARSAAATSRRRTANAEAIRTPSIDRPSARDPGDALMSIGEPTTVQLLASGHTRNPPRAPPPSLPNERHHSPGPGHHRSRGDRAPRLDHRRTVGTDNTRTLPSTGNPGPTRCTGRQPPDP